MNWASIIYADQFDSLYHAELNSFSYNNLQFTLLFTFTPYLSTLFESNCIYICKCHLFFVKWQSPLALCLILETIQLRLKLPLSLLLLLSLVPITKTLCRALLKILFQNFRHNHLKLFPSLFSFIIMQKVSIIWKGFVMRRRSLFPASTGGFLTHLTGRLYR